MFICCASAFCRPVFLSPFSFLGYNIAALSAWAAMGAEHPHWSHWDPGVGSPTSQLISLGSRCPHWSHRDPGVGSPSSPLGSRSNGSWVRAPLGSSWDPSPGHSQIFVPQEHAACILSNKLYRLLMPKLWPLLFEWSASKILSVRTFSERTILCILAHSDAHRRIPARDVAHKLLVILPSSYRYQKKFADT